MRRTYYRQAQMGRNQSSGAEMEKYFCPEPISKGAIYTAIGGVLLLLIGIALLLSGQPSYGAFSLVLAVLGAVLIFIGVTIVWSRSNPSDEQYDLWLDNEARKMIQRALWMLDVHEGQIDSGVLCVRSFVLPDSELAAHYSNHVLLKQGKDGRWRCSVNLYTYFFPTRHYLGIFTSDINALSTSALHDDRPDEYFYREILTPTLKVSQETVLYDGEEHLYRLQQLVLRISNGENIHLGAYLSLVPLDGSEHTPMITLEETGNQQMIVNLRRLLRFKKQGAGP